ncbi:MAG: DUF192 domain-containing protein [Chloroflexi bacterium]|nr:MAG: DUF192 domain-containing protein [Chloroflexota bacterium]
MQGRRAVHERTGKVLAESLEMPRTMFGRGIGLMFRTALAPGRGMWINPCSSIHMMFMRFAIDAVFLDEGVPKASRLVRAGVVAGRAQRARAAPRVHVGNRPPARRPDHHPIVRSPPHSWGPRPFGARRGRGGRAPVKRVLTSCIA